MNPQLQAAYFNRALMHINDVAKYMCLESDSPFEDLRRAIAIGKGSRRDTGYLYYTAARIHATAADGLGKKKLGDFPSNGYLDGNTPVASAGGLLSKIGLFLMVQQEAAYHRQRTEEYAQQALERGYDFKAVAEDAMIKQFLSHIEVPQLTAPVPDTNLQVVDLIPDLGR
jgi:hypothetical protein